MPVFTIDGKEYDVLDKDLDTLAKKHPDAITIASDNDNIEYDIKASDYKLFRERNPTITPAEKEQMERAGVESKFGELNYNIQHGLDPIKERLDNQQEYRDNFGVGQTVATAPKLNMQSGKFEPSYITPVGNKYQDKATADMEIYQYRQAADMSSAAQSRRANKSKAELERLAEERVQAIMDKYRRDQEESQPKTFFEKVAHASAQMHEGSSGMPDLSVIIESDPEFRSLKAAIHEREEQISTIDRQTRREHGDDSGYWRGVGDKALDLGTYDFGYTELQDGIAKTMANSSYNKSDGQISADQALLESQAGRESAQEQFGVNDSKMYRWGLMTGEMPAFMLDFALTGNGFGGIKALGNVGAKVAAKTVGKEVAAEIATQGVKSYIKNNGAKGFGKAAANWSIKALGTAADDILLRAPLMTNTLQAGKTASDAIDRKLGHVIANEDGSLGYSNDMSYGDAIWQTEANSIVENASEMFGTHMDPMLSLENLGKISHTFGAKRLSEVISKIDKGGLGIVLDKTNKAFKTLGAGDYVGEVTEEYYGQVLRTALNLDDAYRVNKDGSRTNLLFTKEFNGDILGGMALSMGVMGAGKLSLSAAGYASIRHGVNKADMRAKEIVGINTWEPLKQNIDAVTNDNWGDVYDTILADPELADKEKVAIADYMQQSMVMRGFNLADLINNRDSEQNEEKKQFNESFTNGYNITSPQEMVDAQNLYEYHTKQIQELSDNWHPKEIAKGDNGIKTINYMRENGFAQEEIDKMVDFVNSAQVYNGMMKGVQDNIDARVTQSDAMIDSRVNQATDQIQAATMKTDDRKVYIIAGNAVPFNYAPGIDLDKSDQSIVVMDAESGDTEMVSPQALLSIEQAQNPEEQKKIAADAIREQYSEEYLAKINGVASFNGGETYTIQGDNQSSVEVQVTPNEQGIIDNGDETVNVTDGANIFAVPKVVIQQSVDAANQARVAEFERQRTIYNTPTQEIEQKEQPTGLGLPYAYDKNLVINYNGQKVNARINEALNEDGLIALDIDSNVQGGFIPKQFTPEELDSMVVEYDGQPVAQPATTEGAPEVEDMPTQEPEAITPELTAMDRIPKNEQGEPIYEQADSDVAWDAIVEQTEGDEQMAQGVVDAMIADKESALKKIEKSSSKGGVSIAEKIAAEKERKAIIEAMQQQITQWKKIASTSLRRQQEAESIRTKQQKEEAELRKAEEDRLRAEQEEAERIEREALKGVPDMLNDTPQDARARGYRRVSGHKADRQLPIQSLQGNEIAVKFSNESIPTGRIAVIDASQLQPSHLQGVRNPLHFIDEAQPKERNDEASILSAQKIASNIRPEEITSSVTAYTGAPTVNSRGEVIQGNNRSDALRLLWSNHTEQAQTYKQYLKDHAEELGLNPDEIEAIERPVLVNMLDVEDNDAIELGQYVAQDTESGGIERIKPKNTLQRMGADMQSFSNILLSSPNEESSFLSLVDTNGAKVLKWMNQKGYISPTQYRSAFDSRGNLTAEVKNDIKGIMYQNIFQGNSTRLEEMFNKMPSKAQKAILATAFRDYDSPHSERMIEEIQNSIKAFYALSQSKEFNDAKNYKEARVAVESWKIQYQIDDVTGESYLPADNFSNFALQLATMYKGESQSFIQNTFKQMYDLIQGTQEENLFEQPDNTPRTLAEAIYETLNIIYNGQKRSDVLASNSTTSQQREQRGDGGIAPGEPVASGDELSNNSRGAESVSGQGGEVEAHSIPQEDKEINLFDPRSMTDEERQRRGSMLQNAQVVIVEENQITSSETLTARQAAEKWWDEHISEPVFYSTEAGEVEINKNSIESSLAHRYGQRKLDAITSLVEGFENAVYLGTMPDSRGDDVVDHYFAYPISYNGILNYVFCRAMQDTNKNRLYVHEVFVADNIKKGDTLQTAAVTPHGGISLYRDILANVLSVNKDFNSLHPKAQIEESIPLNDSNELTNDNNQSALLGINSSIEDSYSKGNNNHANNNELGENNLSEAIEVAEAQTDTDPTEAQKEAGNYKKGHIQVGSFNISIEQPKGSVRSGVDANGKEWQVTMNNTYGYIRGTEGVDGDHIDIFLSSDIDGWNGRRVFVIDQYNPDGSFDEHKVMLGFNEADEAKAEYLKNYEQGWESSRKIVPTSVLIEDFEKWIDSSHRKTKPFAEYKSVKADTATKPVGYSVDKRFHKKNGTNIFAVKFTEQMPREQFTALKKSVKEFGGYYSSFGKGGFIFDAESDAHRFAQSIVGNTHTEQDQPLSIADMSESITVPEVEAQPVENAVPKSKWVAEEDADEFAKLRAAMRSKLGQLNSGIDPEVLAIGCNMSYLLMKNGVRKFHAYSTAMIEEIGEVIRPMLKSLYEATRYTPEVQDSNWSNELSTPDEVFKFNVATFDKTHNDPILTAEMVVAEQQNNKDAEASLQTLKTKKNEQTTANTEAIASEAETIASEAESNIETTTDATVLNDVVSTIDEQLAKVNDQLALLGYYEAEEVAKDFNEAYGYMRNAEKKAVADANVLADKLIKDLGVDRSKIVDRKGKKRKSVAVANIAPIGGDVTIELPITDDAGIYIYLGLEKERGSDNLKLNTIMSRIEHKNKNGYERLGTVNTFQNTSITYDRLLRTIKSLISTAIPNYVLPTIDNSEGNVVENKPTKSKKESKKTVTSQTKVADLFSESSNTNVEINESTNNRNEAVVSGQPDSTNVGNNETGANGGVQSDRASQPITEQQSEAGVGGRVSTDVGASRELEKGGSERVGSQRYVTERPTGEVRIPRSNVKHRRDSRQVNEQSGTDRGGEGVSKGESTTSADSRSVKSTIKKRFVNNYAYPSDASEIDNYTKAQRLSVNVQALDVLRNIILEARQSTAEEREILGRFRGWGGVELGRSYSIDMMRRERNEDIQKLADIIDDLDPKGEKGILAAINRAALSSYYTPTSIARAINHFVQLSGFKEGNLLDPSMGSGIFEGTMPIDIQQRTAICGIELDWLTGQIAKQLYPDSDVRINGFESSNIAPNNYDVVESNIPFGDFGVSDSSWKGNITPIRKAAQSRIHNYFAVKMIEATKKGGLCTIMTSNAILDTKGNQIVRDYIASQCEILGVVRLPDNTFKGAGTSVVTDVIFLRKYRDEADNIDTRSNDKYLENIEAPFLSSTTSELLNKSEGRSYSVEHNAYFSRNPQMIIGEQIAGGQYRRDQYGLTSGFTTDEIGEKLNSLVEKVIVGKRKGKIFNTTATSREVYKSIRESYVGDGDYISNGNIVEQNGKYGVLEAERGKYGDATRTFTEIPRLNSKGDRIKAMLPIRKAMKQLISEQIAGVDDSKLQTIREELKRSYEAYTQKFGKLGDESNNYIEADIDGYAVRSLEKWKEGKFTGLSDIFTKNTIKPALDLTQAKTPAEAISVSLSEYGEVRASFMESILGEKWQEQCGDSIFKIPFGSNTYETRDSYLSGDVKSKLNEARIAAGTDQSFSRNVKALEEVQPEDIDFSDINIRMGARWVSAEMYTDFLRDVYGIKGWNVKSGIAYSPEADEFAINIISSELGGKAEEWKTERRSASDVFEAALKDKTLVVYDIVKSGDTEVKVVNKDQTELVNSKIQDLRSNFEDWLSQDSKRVEQLTSTYNDMFNRTVLRKFNGSHLNVSGLMGMELRPHQKDAVWMLVNNRGGIVDHIVGAGKTLVMQSAIMEMRRMGIAKKPMIVALKSTVAQIAKEFNAAYPAARILAPTEKDFEKVNRKKFLSNIALNDYDCVILSHDQYKMLPHSEEIETSVINEQLTQLDNAIEFLYGQSDKSSLTKKQIKGLEKRKANLEAKLSNLLDRKVDREFTFENLGVDYLFVDECQAFKSLPYVTSYQNVAGLGSAKGSQGAIALLNGIRYLQKLHQGDKGTIFLSGTTISNSLVEIYNLMQYLRPREMERLGLKTFDAWASQFAVRSYELEYGVTNELKEKNRFRNFDNVPELAKMYAEIADVRNDLNLVLPKPKGNMHIVTVPTSDSLSEINQEVINMVNHKDGSYFGFNTNARSPFGLLASTTSAKAAISTKLIFPDSDEADGKIKYVCENVKKIYDQFSEQKGTQLIFCDTGVPVKGKPYDAYTDIIDRLTNEYGIPREEIADIHIANNDQKRKALFAKVNDGQVRILIGGTKNMGTGVNVQKRITALHHIDVPWTPADREQREGRGVRQGNEIARDFNNNNVDIFFYATEGSLDMYKYQLQDTKGKMFAQFKQGTVGERNFDEGNGDEEGGFDPAEIVALLSGNPIIFDKSKQDKLVEKLRRAKRAYESDWQRRKAKFESLKESKKKYEQLIRLNERDNSVLDRGNFKPSENGTYPSDVTVSILSSNGTRASQKTFDKPKEAGAYIHKQLSKGKKVELSGFGMTASIGISEGNDGLFSGRVIELNAPSGIKYTSSLSEDDTNAGLAFRNVLMKVVNNNGVYKRSLEDVERQLEGADPKENIFPKQEQLDKAIERKKELDAEYKKLSADEEKKEDDDIMLRDGDFTPEEQDIIDNAGDNAFKAPNGKPTNLTHKQWAQVRTKAFKEWFGDWEANPKEASKVVDANGEPLVVYHGGEANINTFMNMKDNPNYSNTKHQGYTAKDRVGIYFSKYKDVAESYKRPYGKAGAIYSVFLDIKKPYKVSYLETLKNRLVKFGTLGIVNKKTVDQIRSSELDTIYSNYDGVIHGDGLEYVTFSSNQIKSAIDNNGEFSSDSSDIRFRDNKDINEQFNTELQQQIDGTLPKGHVYKLGMPSEVLLSAGFDSLPIELVASRLSDKSMQENHPFDLFEVEDLPRAIQNPIAVMRSATRLDSKVLFTELVHGGKNFVVAIQMNKMKGRLEINDIRSVHYRTAQNISNLINDGLLDYVDKKKISEWFSKQRYNSAEVRKSLRDATKIVKDFVNPTLSSNNNTNERSSSSSRIAPTRADIRKMESHAKAIAKKLNLDNVEILDNTKGLEGKKRRAKGFYTKNTGKITIVAPNNSSIEDIEQTMLHEAVAHHGLRKLFGDHFEEFLDKIFANADESVRKNIVELSRKNHWDFRKATEEYLATLAENTNFENAQNEGWWQKIKSFFADMLKRLDFSGSISDNELRYILWKSYENLKSGSKNNIFSEAADIAMQNDLKVGEYADDISVDDTFFRESDPEMIGRSYVSEVYEKRITSNWYQTKEAIQDSMLSVKEFMLDVCKAEGKKLYIEDIAGFENAYEAENRSSGTNESESEAFIRLKFDPLFKAMASLAPDGVSDEDLIDYLFAKHGLERNIVMAERAAQKALDKYKKLHPNTKKTINDFIDNFRKKDYAGLTALTGFKDVKTAESEAQRMVDEYENDNDTKGLWNAINDISKSILSKQYECGMISKETFDKISCMYQYYIPLRGFDEKTSAEAYAYLSDSKGAFGSSIKGARGRRSKADNPILNLMMMAQSAIMQGNRNKLVKQTFLNFVLNHPSDLVSVSDLWLEYDEADEVWKPKFPAEISVTDTHEEVEAKMKAFEERMTALAKEQPEKYKHGKDAVNIPYRVVGKDNLKEHQIIVKRGGRSLVLTINGNPRLAQAINGLTNPDSESARGIDDMMKFLEQCNRWYSQVYTAKNPDFLVSNFLRDGGYTNIMVWVKESPKYARQFNKNYLKFNPATMMSLYYKYNNNTLDMNDPVQKMFYQFKMNGGETGYMNARDIEGQRDQLNKKIRKMQKKGKISTTQAMGLLGDCLGNLSDSIENGPRFAAFVTSKENGRDLARSIHDAKEISVNFNKKGSGAKFYRTQGQTLIGSTAAMVSGLGRGGFIFWNAAIQGTTNFGRAAKRNPKNATILAAALFTLGAIISTLNGSGDDDDDYYNIPESVRRSNILIKCGDYWVSIPLGIEYRAIYGMGELMTSVLSGKEHLSGWQVTGKVLGQMSQILPIDFMDGGPMAAVPTFAKSTAEVVFNKNWAGQQIYKDFDYNKDMPNWTKAYSSSNKYIVNMCAALNEATGGDDDIKGRVDLNPAIIEHLLESTFGGYYGTADKLIKSAEMIMGNREYQPQNIPLWNRLVREGGEPAAKRTLNRKYYELKEEYDTTDDKLDKLQAKAEKGVFGYAEKVKFMHLSPEFERHQIFEKYKPTFNDLFEALNDPRFSSLSKDIEADRFEAISNMVSEMESTYK